jgi:hypothetical protein
MVKSYGVSGNLDETERATVRMLLMFFLQLSIHYTLLRECCICSILPSRFSWRPPGRPADQLAGLAISWPVFSAGQPARMIKF